MARKLAPSLDVGRFLAKALRNTKASKQYRERQAVFSQGDPADAVFYIEAGKVQVAVRSKQKKEAVIAILEPGSFFGEECMVAGQSYRLATASCLECSNLLRIEKGTLVRLLQDARFSDRFTSHLLSRNLRIQEDLIDQLFNSSEKRLARLLLLLSHFGKEGKPELVTPRVSQQTMAAMVGTTRSRVSFFLNKFRKLGFVDYNGGLLVHSSLLNVILHD
jgi:CRP/FNR family transcriptional regulator, cyclic AMP receptor protein